MHKNSPERTSKEISFKTRSPNFLVRFRTCTFGILLSCMVFSPLLQRQIHIIGN